MARSFTEAFQIPRAVGHGWEAVRAAPLPLLLGALLVQCTESGSGGGSNALNTSETTTGGGGGAGEGPDLHSILEQFSSMTVGVIVGIVACLVVVAILLFAARCWIRPGYTRLQVEVLTTGKGSAGALFRAGDVFWKMVRWRLLRTFVVTGTMMVAILPGGLLVLLAWPQRHMALVVAGGALAAVVVLPVLLYVSFGLYFGDYCVALDRAGAMEALERSWDLAKGNRWSLLLFTGVLGLFSISGFLLCCIGVILTRCISETGATEAWLLFTHDEAETAQMWSIRSFQS
jgi:hypothetical protein